MAACRYLALDEADRMVDLGFEEEVCTAQRARDNIERAGKGHSVLSTLARASSVMCI
jgi:hypothetical protein